MNTCYSRVFKERHPAKDWLVYNFSLVTLLGQFMAETTDDLDYYEEKNLYISVILGFSLASFLVAYENLKPQVNRVEGGHAIGESVPQQLKDRLPSAFSALLLFDAINIFFPGFIVSKRPEVLIPIFFIVCLVATKFASPFLKDSVSNAISQKDLQPVLNHQDCSTKESLLNTIWGLSLSGWFAQFVVALPEELGFHFEAVSDFQESDLFYYSQTAVYALYTAYAMYISYSLKGNEKRFIEHLEYSHPLFFSALSYRGYSHSMYCLLIVTDSLENPPFALYTALGLGLMASIFLYEYNNLSNPRDFARLNNDTNAELIKTVSEIEIFKSSEGSEGAQSRPDASACDYHLLEM